jgi:hypothetical protein
VTTRRILVSAGILTMAYAIAGALTDPDVRILGVLLFLVALIALHDAVFLPLVLGAGALIGRFVPVRRQPAVRIAGLISLAITVTALPLALGFGRDPGNPSALPLAYPRNLIMVLIVIWVLSLLGRKGFARPRRRPSR